MNYRFFFYLYSHKIFFWLFVITFCCQVFFWHKFENVKPAFDIIPPAPSKEFVSAASLGDKEFLFRVLATRLQNSGDVFAGFVALRNYDYKRIYDWMKALDELNSKSDYTPSLASYYYAQTQKKSDNKYIVKYLDEYASKDIDAKWWWFIQAIYIAQRDLDNFDYALELAKKMSQNNAQNAPLWTKEMPAFIYARMGEDCAAFAIIEKILKENAQGLRQVKPEEMNFMRHFINDRLVSLKNKNFDPQKCKKH